MRLLEDHEHDVHDIRRAEDDHSCRPARVKRKGILEPHNDGRPPWIRITEDECRMLVYKRGPEGGEPYVFWFDGIDIEDDAVDGSEDGLLERLIHELRHLYFFLKQTNKPAEGSGSLPGKKVGPYDRTSADPSEHHGPGMPQSGIEPRDNPRLGRAQWKAGDTADVKKTRDNEKAAKEREAKERAAKEKESGPSAAAGGGGSAPPK